MGLLKEPDRQRAADAATDLAKDLGREGITALEREAQRRREDACAEKERLRAKVTRLEGIKAERPLAPFIRWRIRAAKNQLGRAEDRCAAIEALRR